jgi:4-oxalocrotonate tautomerase
VPIINIKFIEGVVATSEQKIELVQKMTDTFVEVLGDVVRPFTYCIIDETPPMQWGIAGVPMPDLEYLTTRHMDVIERANELMRQAMAEMAKAEEAQEAEKEAQPKPA